VSERAETLLGGRVAYRQSADGYRTGIEPVLLAACVPARSGDRVIEAGTGAGAGLLCLTQRVPGVRGVGVELDAATAALARENLTANRRHQIEIVTADVTAAPLGPAFDHAMANPPWHDNAGTPPGEPRRMLAKQAEAGLLEAWIAALARALGPRGTLSLILPAARLAAATTALSHWDCPEITLLPLWPRQGVPAKLLLLQGVRGGKGACKLLPGLVLHEANGKFTAAAEAVLRGGSAIHLTQARKSGLAMRPGELAAPGFSVAAAEVP
jgi:tRNA1(Val) A37 N6-methylase TrmN6